MPQHSETLVLMSRPSATLFLTSLHSNTGPRSGFKVLASFTQWRRGGPYGPAPLFRSSEFCENTDRYGVPSTALALCFRLHHRYPAVVDRLGPDAGVNLDNIIIIIITIVTNAQLRAQMMSCV